MKQKISIAEKNTRWKDKDFKLRFSNDYKRLKQFDLDKKFIKRSVGTLQHIKRLIDMLNGSSENH